MASNQTANYQLNQWEPEDKVLRTDFNADNLKIDGALHALAETAAEHSAAIARLGNCKIIYGIYTGNGLYGAANPNTLLFDHAPIAVFITPTATIDGSLGALMLIRGGTISYTFQTLANSGNAVIWGDHSVSWYAYAENAMLQFNVNNAKYAYAAFLVEE